ncbi:MAG TPA: hypothetical protein VG963_18965 [Polyangiaceae bacterium]|nr:hypothetical protein [Polyangiaceae bacterium]
MARAFDSELLLSEAAAALASEDFARADCPTGALDAGVFFGALELLVLLGRSDLFVPTGYLFLFSTF